MKLKKVIFVIALLSICNLTQLMAAPIQSVSQTSDSYSGRDDLKTIGLGRSAYTSDGESGVGVNIYQKTDGTYVVQVLNTKINRGRTQITKSKDYIKAWRDKKDRICFIWYKKEYHTNPQIF